MKIITAIILSIFTSIALAAPAEIEYYSVTKPMPEATAPGNANLMVESNKGTWFGPVLSQPGITMPTGYTTMGMRFEFTTDSYFSASNAGHIAIGIRGDGYNGLLGRGIVIGNVSGLSGDSGTSQAAAIAIESFWATGNAVYGKATEGTVLENDTLYRVTIVSKGVDAEVIGYTLEKKIDAYWVTVDQREVVDHKGKGQVSADLAGWFIVEVFSNHAWNYQIKNLNVWYE